MNRVVKVQVGRQSAGHESTPVPFCLLLELINALFVDFVTLVFTHNAQLQSASGQEFVQTICKQHKDLVCFAQEALLMLQ